MTTTAEDAAIEAIARAIANGQGCNFDSLYAGPKLQVLRDARSAYRAIAVDPVAAERKRITDAIAFITADLDPTDWAEALTAFEDALHIVNNPKPAAS